MIFLRMDPERVGARFAKMRCKVVQDLKGSDEERPQLALLVGQLAAAVRALQEVKCEVNIRVYRGAEDAEVRCDGEVTAHGSQAFLAITQLVREIYIVAAKCVYLCPGSSFTITATQVVRYNSR